MRLDAVAGATDSTLDVLAAALARGEVVGLPTDTVYGVGADPTVEGAVARLFELKGRPGHVAVPLLVADLAQARTVAVVPPAGERLAAAFWPGALTVVLPARIDLGLGGDGATVGVRCAAHPVMRAACLRCGPLAVTSANLHGQSPLTTADAVAATFPDLLVVDAGLCDGVPSTVVDATGDEVRLLREGGVAWEAVLDSLRS
ncbi:MAG TPA: L-threonylcarbamoyladenylate synthase [Acidimicrobiales bacterium]|nr:L-threonylcarbamoyladenylate synthase [Acidimicrobiales bacterium]